MLHLDDIIRLKVQKYIVENYQARVDNNFLRKDMSQYLNAIGEVVMAHLLKIPIDTFIAQYRTARKMGVAMLLRKDDKLIGIDVATSVIHTPNKLLTKHMILTPEHTNINNGLTSKAIIGVFIPHSCNDRPDNAEVLAAGWLNAKHINEVTNVKPKSFKSDIDVKFVKCSSLNPMQSLPKIAA